MSIKANEMKRGLALNIDGDVYIVSEFQLRTPGNLRSFYQVKLKNLKTGLVTERRMRSDESLEPAFLERRPMQYLYKDTTGFVFMELENYEQYTLDTDLVGDAAQYLVPEIQVLVVLCDGKPAGVDLPASVDMKITETDAAIKGQTATKGYKPAITETGMKVMVPPFLNAGEVIKVDTREGKYLSRA